MKRKWMAVLLAVNLVLSGSTLAFAAETDGSSLETPAVDASETGTKDKSAGNETGTGSSDMTGEADNGSNIKAAKTVLQNAGTENGAGTDEEDAEKSSGADETKEVNTLAEEDDNARTGDSAEASGTLSNGITWELADGVLTVSGSGVPGQELGESVGDSQVDQITSVKIEEGITGIGYGAFWYFENLTEVSIPGSVKEIGAYAFHGCLNLKKVSIPDGVTEIGFGAFWGCASLPEVLLPNSLIRMNNYAFAGCASLTKVAIPTSVNEIGDLAFNGCTGLTEVSIPGSITKISASAFRGCENLANITIPKGVTAIEYKAFEGCKSLLEVTIPSNVKTMGHGAFANCTGLDSVIFEGDAPEIAKDRATEEPFQNVTAIAKHPSGNSTWTSEVRKALGSKLAWEFASSPKEPAGTTSPKKEVLRIVPEVTDYTYVIGSGDGATIKCTGELKDFVSAYMDGVEVDRSNYTLREGSTILTFTSKYLDTLSVGKHKVTLKYTYASIDTELNILERSSASGSVSDTAANGAAGNGVAGNSAASGNGTNTSGRTGAPKTGDEAPVLPWVVISVLAAGICVTAASKKRCLFFNS